MSAPLVRIAHRGGGSLAPENSLEGIELSINYGVEMVEVDVRRTSDGALVLAHDPLVRGSALPVAASTLAELAVATAASSRWMRRSMLCAARCD